MAETMTFELVSPERRLARVDARSVVLPGQLGELTAMPGHAPFFTTLRPGYVTVDDGAGGRFFVTGGFAEINQESLAVLAEEAVEAEAVTADWLDAKIAAAKEALAEAGEDRKTVVGQIVDDYGFLRAQLG
ncbi:MAG: ATP synthase F1 subunit epsilon [Pikeienuella sp.]